SLSSRVPQYLHSFPTRRSSDLPLTFSSYNPNKISCHSKNLDGFDSCKFPRDTPGGSSNWFKHIKSSNSAPAQKRKRLFNWSQSTDSLYVCSANNCNTGKEVVSGVSAPLSPHIVAKTSFIPSFLLAVNAASLVAKPLP